MTQATNSRVRADQGFTLVELLVALTIIAMLAAIVLPRSWAFLDRALDQAAFTIVHAIEQRGLEAQMQGVVITVDPATLLPTNLPAPVTLTSDVRSLMMFPDGSSSGGLFLLDDGMRTIEIVVVWSTGRVQVGNRTGARG